MTHVINKDKLPRSGTGTGRAQHIDIHTNHRMVTKWIEEDRPGGRDRAAGARRGPAGGEA